MSDPKRLLSSGASPFQQQLLRAGKEEAPSAEAQKKAAIALGLIEGPGPGGPTGSEGAGGTASGAGSAASGAGSVAGSATILKWGAAALLGGGVAVGISVADFDAEPPKKERPAQTTVQSPPTPKPIPVPAPVIEPQDPPRPAPVPKIPHRKTKVKKRVQKSLAEEIAMIDRARALLLAGSPEKATRTLNTYGRRFPRGTLLEEAALLAVRAAAKKDDNRRTRVLAREFLEKHPDSPLADSVRRIQSSTSAIAK